MNLKAEPHTIGMCSTIIPIIKIKKKQEFSNSSVCFTSESTLAKLFTLKRPLIWDL